MDPRLIDYIKSGEAWLLIGSGVSTASGIPTWQSLAKESIRFCISEGYQNELSAAQTHYDNKEYPQVFSEIEKQIGLPSLVNHLNQFTSNAPINDNRIYRLISNWPISVYLTTNYDDLLQQSLVGINESFKVYSNSPDHMRILDTDIHGAIYKLHGDLTSTNGLILTHEQYDAIAKSDEWEYWRV